MLAHLALHTVALTWAGRIVAHSLRDRNLDIWPRLSGPDLMTHPPVRTKNPICTHWLCRSVSDGPSRAAFAPKLFGDCLRRHKNCRKACPSRRCAKSGVCSGGNEFVTMMLSANLRDFHDATNRWRFESVD
jgi:hypothetical protein